MEDVELLYYIHQRSDEALAMLLQKYRKILEIMVYQLIRQDSSMAMYFDDLLQKAQMTFVSAMEYFRDDQGCTFKTYIQSCIRRGLYAHLRQLKQGIESKDAELVHLDEIRILPDGSEVSITETIASGLKIGEPMYHYDFKEAQHRLADYQKKLGSSEKNVLHSLSYLGSVQERAQGIGMDERKYRYMVQKVKKGLRKQVIEPGFID